MKILLYSYKTYRKDKGKFVPLLNQTRTIHIYMCNLTYTRRQVNSVQWLICGREGQGLIPGRDRHFCLRHRVQTGCGAHRAFYQMGSRGKATGAWSDHSALAQTQVKNMWCHLHSNTRIQFYKAPVRVSTCLWRHHWVGTTGCSCNSQNWKITEGIGLPLLTFREQ